VAQQATTAAMPNAAQRSASDLRATRSAFHSASSPNAPTSTRPNTKPPCRLAHKAIHGSSHGDGASPRPLADISPLAHTSMIGSTSTCGRARKCPIESTSTANATATA
jgi:hypothetical protein